MLSLSSLPVSSAQLGGRLEARTRSTPLRTLALPPPAAHRPAEMHSAMPTDSRPLATVSAPRPIGTLDKLGHERGVAPWTAEVGARLAAGRARAKEAATTEAEAPRPSQQRVPPWAGVPQPEPEPPLEPRAEEGVPPWATVSRPGETSNRSNSSRVSASSAARGVAAAVTPEGKEGLQHLARHENPAVALVAQRALARAGGS